MSTDSPETAATAPPKKVSASKVWLRALETSSKLTADPAQTIADLIDAKAAEFGGAPALIDEREQFSFEQLADRARRYARWGLGLGLKRGDGVALLMPNRADYFAVWTGLTRLGVVVSLLNTNLRGAALAHCVNVVRPAHLVADARLIEAVDGVRDKIDAGLTVWRVGGDGPDRALDAPAFDGAPFEPDAFAPATQRDTALHIFTSGTTGMPKAARISHGRIMSWIGWFAGLLGATPDDRLYNCLPMYHSVGGVTAVGAMLAGGGAVVIREKFSASRFWVDVTRSRCTILQYIGELCRYLLAAPERPEERGHGLRLICGNGLREDVWTGFQARFAIPAVFEFYAATEGSFSLYNVEGKVGSIGRAPPFLAHRFPAAIVHFDPDTESPVRGEDGACIPCAPDEVGEAIGKVADAAAGARAFEGYSDAAASERKLLRDVFEPGDVWFRTGDLMRKDAAGFFYFVDRIGDTYRWKGENVSTQEVADAVARFAGVREAAVYGVAVPGADGRAGMAAVAADEGFDVVGLAAHLEEQLPSFAQPLFLRLMDELPATETFKLKKASLVNEAYDPAFGQGRLYWLDPDAGSYQPLDAAAYARLQAGQVRL